MTPTPYAHHLPCFSIASFNLSVLSSFFETFLPAKQCRGHRFDFYSRSSVLHLQSLFLFHFFSNSGQSTSSCQAKKWGSMFHPRSFLLCITDVTVLCTEVIMHPEPWWPQRCQAWLDFRLLGSLRGPPTGSICLASALDPLSWGSLLGHLWLHLSGILLLSLPLFLWGPLCWGSSSPATPHSGHMSVAAQVSLWVLGSF